MYTTYIEGSRCVTRYLYAITLALKIHMLKFNMCSLNIAHASKTKP